MKKTNLFHAAILLFLCFVFDIPLHAQIISTFAGSAISGDSLDGGPATDARIGHPWSVVVGISGDVYFSTAYHEHVKKVNTLGIITTIVGNDSIGYSGDGGPATDAKLNGISGIAVDSSGNLFIADANNLCIRKVSASGIITTFAGIPPLTAGYTGDGGPATAATLTIPTGVAADRFGNVYIADYYNNVIRKVNGGIITTFAGTGIGGHSGDGGPATAAQLRRPLSVAVDSAGNVYIGDSLCYVRKVDISGIITTIAGYAPGSYFGDGGPATDAHFFAIMGIAVDNIGNVYLSDQGNSRVRVINKSGIVSTYAGTGTNGYNGDGGPANLAQINQPWGVALDHTGCLYIADDGNNRIRKVSAPTDIPVTNKIPGTFTILPNPTTGYITIAGSEKVNIKLYNMLGQLIKEANNTDNISISEFPSGMYFIRLFNTVGLPIYQDKIIKQ
jgi:trimeric autotransporter adhesin